MNIQIPLHDVWCPGAWAEGFFIPLHLHLQKNTNIVSAAFFHVNYDLTPVASVDMEHKSCLCSQWFFRAVSSRYGHICPSIGL